MKTSMTIISHTLFLTISASPTIFLPIPTDRFLIFRFLFVTLRGAIVCNRESVRHTL